VPEQQHQSSVVGQWLALAARPSVVKRGLTYAVIVGAILITINHYDALIKGSVDGERLFKMGLTVIVPYLVSTFSSVGAMRQAAKAESP
jgi:hypothetical protein